MEAGSAAASAQNAGQHNEQDLYKAVFRRVWDLAENPRPENIITDYEIALQQGLRQVTGLSVAGCYFHFLQVTPECFSVYGRSHRTSNVAENYHSFLARNLGPGPNVWAFTNTMAVKFNNCSARRQSQLSGRPGPVRRNRAQQMVRLNIIAHNNTALAAGVITIAEFISRTSARLNIGLGHILEEVPDMAEEVEVADEQALPVALVEADAWPVPLPPPAAPEPAGAGPRCGICLDASPTRVLVSCGHTLCEACLLGIQQAGGANRDQCPYCRMLI